MFNDIVNEYRLQYGENLQVIGLRGSRALGIADEHSDTDYLIVVSNLKKNETTGDIQVINIKTFINSINKCEISGAEAINNAIYINNKFFDTYRKLLRITETSHYSKGLTGCLLSVLKGYYKRQDKTNKIISKIYLYYTLLTDYRYKNLANVYKSKQIYKDTILEYRAIRNSKYTIIDKNNLLENVRKLIELKEVTNGLYDKSEYNIELIKQGIQKEKIIAIEKRQVRR